MIMRCLVPVVWTTIGLAVVSSTRAEETRVTRPEVFLQHHHEHSPLTYSNPTRLDDGTLVRYGVDRRGSVRRPPAMAGARGARRNSRVRPCPERTRSCRC